MSDRRGSWIHAIPKHCEKALNSLANPTEVDDVLFDLLADKDGLVSIAKFWNAIRSTGLRLSDRRLRETREQFAKEEEEHTSQERTDDRVDRETFRRCIASNIFLIGKAFKNDMIIPEFFPFTRHIQDIFYKCKGNTSGKTATYIPQLARVDPNIWGISLCTIDGQRYSIGDTELNFCLQSCCKPINYALAISELGATEVHKWVGQEPSGSSFNELTLDNNKKPHNPMINSGAIVITSLLKRKLCLADRYDHVSNQYKRLAGGEFIGFSNSTYLSERESADRNFALGYYMRENKCFPDTSQDLQQTLEFYFQLCSVECNTDSGAVIASTLANGGICPITGERVLAGDAVRNTLSLMYSCGMYDYSGKFAFKVGLPAKSGVAGAILLVVPNVMGICCWSPALDPLGNSCRGVQFCDELIKLFNFHNYDDLNHSEKKLDPRKRKNEDEATSVVNLLFGAANGDITAIRRFALSGMNLSSADYDGRTSLHLAAAEGHLNVVKFLLEKLKVPHDPKDRWGNGPLADAERFGHQAVVDYLVQYSKRFEKNNPREEEKNPQQDEVGLK